MSVERKHKHSINMYTQTLLPSHRVCGLHMRAIDDNDMTALLLLTGLFNGDIAIYRSPLSHAQLIEFTLLQCFHAHNGCITVLHIHPTKLMFVSASPDGVKIWGLKDVTHTTPQLIQYIKLIPNCVQSAKLSHIDMLLTGCDNGVIRVRDVKPPCSLRWICHLPGGIYSVAWSPSSSRIAASFHTSSAAGMCGVQVWDSTFRTLFKHLGQHGAYCNNFGMSFASDDLLICSGYTSRRMYAYNIQTSKGAIYPHSDDVFAVMSSLSLQIVCASCCDGTMRIYEVLHNESALRLLETLYHRNCTSLVSYWYPYKDVGYVCASVGRSMRQVRIRVTNRFNQYWVQKVTKVLFNSNTGSAILPFCRDVHKIILKYLT